MVRNKELFVGGIHAVTFHGKVKSIEENYWFIGYRDALPMEDPNAESQSIKQQEIQCCPTDCIARHLLWHMQLGLHCSETTLKIFVTTQSTISWSAVKYGKENEGWCHWIATRRARRRAV